MSKKPKIGSVSKLKTVVDAVKSPNEKTNVMLRVDAKLLASAQAKFGRKMSAIFEAALEDAMRIDKESKKTS